MIWPATRRAPRPGRTSSWPPATRSRSAGSVGASSVRRSARSTRWWAPPTGCRSSFGSVADVVDALVIVTLVATGAVAVYGIVEMIRRRPPDKALARAVFAAVALLAVQ